MSEPSEYYNESAIPSRNLHRENLDQEEREIARRTSRTRLHTRAL
jgi:hypothetical protein